MKVKIDSKPKDTRAKADDVTWSRKALRVKTRVKAGPIFRGRTGSGGGTDNPQ
jgi:hypothetical protein